MSNPNKELCARYIKERLSFTDSIKYYKDLTAEQKKKISEKEFQ